MKTTVLVAFCAVGAAAAVLGSIRNHRRLRGVGKTFASAMFLTVAALRGDFHQPYALCILLGLGLSAIGDVLLLGSERTYLRSGIAAFLAAHIAYTVAVLSLGTPQPARGWPIAVVIAIAAAALRYVLPHAGRLRAAVATYIVCITCMVLAALSIPQTPPLFAIGVVAFFVSDLFVARQRFVKPAASNRLLGLPLYYGAQLCIAISLASPG